MLLSSFHDTTIHFALKIEAYTTAKTLIRFKAIDPTTNYNFAYIIDAGVVYMGRNINNSLKFNSYNPKIYSSMGYEDDTVDIDMGILTNTGKCYV